MLIVGLGNPGKQYENTRHNVGFMVIGEIMLKYNFPTSVRTKKFNAELSEGNIDNTEVILAKPLTFMNNSGEAVQKIMQFYKILPEQIIVIHDELALPLCKVRVKTGGGDAGHNGIKSIDAHIGRNYQRIRIGVAGEITENYDTSSYVLGKFTKEELNKIGESNKKIAEFLPLLLNGRADLFMNRIAIT